MQLFPNSQNRTGGRSRASMHADGFTIIEVVISLTVFAVMSLSTLLVLLPVNRQAEITRRARTAAWEAERIIERIQAAPFSTVLTSYPQGHVIRLPSLEDGSVTIQYADVPTEPLDITTDLLDISVTVTWPNPRDDFETTRTFRTLKAQ